jgi:hypothetical protein
MQPSKEKMMRRRKIFVFLIVLIFCLNIFNTITLYGGTFKGAVYVSEERKPKDPPKKPNNPKEPERPPERPGKEPPKKPERPPKEPEKEKEKKSATMN